MILLNDSGGKHNLYWHIIENYENVTNISLQHVTELRFPSQSYINIQIIHWTCLSKKTKNIKIGVFCEKNINFNTFLENKKFKKFAKYFLNIFIKRHMTFPFEWYINFVNYFERIWREKQFMFVCYRKTRKINLLYCVTCVTFKPKNHRNDIGNIDKPGRKILTKSKGSW